MPELPEVETIARNLRQHIQGKQILNVDVRWERSIAQPKPEIFRARIASQEIVGISRRAKYLRLHLEQDELLIHLRMSGDVSVDTLPYKPAKHDRLVFSLSDQLAVAFNDTRKFGRVWLTDDAETVLAGLGPEPLSPDFSAARLFDGLRSRKRQLKPLLLDQSFIAGLGNIYTDEALHRARLHPLTRSDTVTTNQAELLWESIRHVLTLGISQNGASIDWVYRGGGFQNHFNVYSRTDQPCYTCGTLIKRLVVGQRGTHICPACQVEAH